MITSDFTFLLKVFDQRAEKFRSMSENGEEKVVQNVDLPQSFRLDMYSSVLIILLKTFQREAQDFPLEVRKLQKISSILKKMVVS